VLSAADKAISIFAAWSLSFSVFGWRIAFEIGDEGHDCQQFVIHALLEHMTLERYVGILVVGAIQPISFLLIQVSDIAIVDLIDRAPYLQAFSLFNTCGPAPVVSGVPRKNEPTIG
jgi:hypothetical protein